MAHKRPSGFTLLEVIAALSVTSLIVLAIASSLAAVSQGWDRGERRYAGREATRVIVERLGRELVCLDRGPFGQAAAFNGDQTGFSLSASGDGGPRRLSLTLDGKRVILTEELLRRPEGTAVTPIILAEDVEALDLSYYDPAARNWTRDWPAKERGRPPSLIRLEVSTGEPGRARRSPPVILPIYAGRVMAREGVDPLE